MHPPAFIDVRRITHGLGTINALTFNADGSLLVGCGLGDLASIKMWDPVTGHEVRQSGQAAGCVTSFSLSPDETLVAAGSRRGLGGNDVNMLSLWDVASGQEVFRVKSAPSSLNNVAFSPDGLTIATAGLVPPHHGIALWDSATGQEVLRLSEHVPEVRTLTFNATGSVLVGGREDGYLHLWDMATGKTTQFFTMEHSIYACAFSPDGSFLAAGDEIGVVRVWHVATGRLRYVLPGGGGLTPASVYALAFRSDGALLAGAFGDEYSHWGSAFLWDVVSEPWRSAFTGFVTEYVVYALAIHPHGHILAVSGDDASIELWTLQ